MYLPSTQTNIFSKIILRISVIIVWITTLNSFGRTTLFVYNIQSNFQPVGCFNFNLVVRRAIIRYSDGKSNIVVQ